MSEGTPIKTFEASSGDIKIRCMLMPDQVTMCYSIGSIENSLCHKLASREKAEHAYDLAKLTFRMMNYDVKEVAL